MGIEWNPLKRAETSERLNLKSLLADERVYAEKHREEEPYGDLHIEGVDEITRKDRERLEKALRQLAAYTGGILINDYFEQRHAEPDGRRAWRRMMREQLRPYPTMLQEFIWLIDHDKKRLGTIDHFVLRAIDTIEQYLSKEGIDSSQTAEFDTIVSELPRAIMDKVPYYDRLKDEDKMLVVEKTDSIARRLLHLFAPVKN